MNLKSKIGNYTFENPLMNASGCWCESEEKLNELQLSDCGSFVTKSATAKYREGNPSPRYVEVPLGTINSMGLPNEGLDYYLDYALKFQEKHEQTIFLSVAGMSFEENIEMLKKVNSSDFKGIIELNLSCPNVPGKPQTGYDFEATERILQEVFTFIKKPLGVKLPPYFDMAHFDKIAEVLNKFPLHYVNCINSIGNGLYIDTKKEEVVIRPKDGFGGIGGEYIKPTALANVRAMYTRLNKNIQVIGCGGVLTGQDVFEHILCGASMVQVGSQLMKENPSIFGRLLSELKEIMSQKGYQSIDDFKGKLKSL